MKTDLELRQDVERQLAWDPQVDHSKIAVLAKNGVVTLTGEVPTYFDKWEAVKDAKRILGVTGIAENLEVTLSGAKPDDTDLTEKVLNSLRWHVAIPKDKIRPIVSNGWVTLEGTVQWHYQKEAAAAAVRYLHGVKGVTDSIVVKNLADAKNVSDMIVESLMRNARIDASHISVKMREHTATLEGTVRSVAERDEAEAAAWSAPSVNAVENHLSVSYRA
ncbi:VCBS repeat-containing protein [Burkholderia sp. WP9]|uniref:BON domain-containing protein n=1 Tax=Burkholderia sp. WP9 TaxID=1500263 RepID=UPI00089631F0|nr:BON domain-containing protein [Burkholderia sp. WP9]SEC02237.1 VCBS repeat-containing protein [Burkholderia sp. WP9]